MKKGRFLSTLFNLKVEGQDDVRVICRNVQRDVVKDLPTHVDLMRLRRTSRINLFIPVEIVGREDAPGLRKGGVLTMVRPEVELVVTAGDIPEKITASIAGMGINDTLTISMIDLPEGAKPVIDRDFVIANIQPPSGLASQRRRGGRRARSRRGSRHRAGSRRQLGRIIPNARKGPEGPDAFRAVGPRVAQTVGPRGSAVIRRPRDASGRFYSAASIPASIGVKGFFAEARHRDLSNFAPAFVFA